MKCVDMVGMVFGRLTVISLCERKNNRTYCNCKCLCGVEKLMRADGLRSGTSRSCGCLLKDSHKKRLTKHGQARNSIYYSWENMVQRCTNQNTPNYKNYGGRGICITNSWLIFENFYKDMGEKPKGLSLDRIDNNGNYCKENCRWATRKEQANNTRTNTILEYNSVKKTLSQWADTLGMRSASLIKRINKGLTGADLFSKSNSHIMIIEHAGEKHTLREWAILTDIPYETLYGRFKRGIIGQELFAKNRIRR